MSEIDAFVPSKPELFVNFFNDKYGAKYHQNVGSRWGVYYKWMGALVRKMKFKNILELGTGTGASSICIFSEMPDGAALTTIDRRVDSGNFLPKAMLEDPRFNVIHKSSTKVSKEEVRNGIDLLFIDSLHVYAHARPEFDLFIPLCSDGCLVVMDDIHSHDMDRLWNEIPYDKLDITKDCHGQAGFGVFYVER